MKPTPPTRKQGLGWLTDLVSNLTGYAAIRVPLQRASRPREVTLNLPGYWQIDSYSCGGIAAAMVVQCLRPQVSFQRVHSAVAPLPETGAGTTRVTRALRSLGIGVACRPDLTFDTICDAIDAGRPVVACVTTADPCTDHWVVLYGYGRRPNLVFVARQGFPFLAKHRTPWREFRREWSLRGLGLVCWKALDRERGRPSHSPKEKK